jgi:hypothetical protein
MHVAGVSGSTSDVHCIIIVNSMGVIQVTEVSLCCAKCRKLTKHQAFLTLACDLQFSRVQQLESCYCCTCTLVHL